VEGIVGKYIDRPFWRGVLPIIKSLGQEEGCVVTEITRLIRSPEDLEITKLELNSILQEEGVERVVYFSSPRLARSFCWLGIIPTNGGGCELPHRCLSLLREKGIDHSVRVPGLYRLSMKDSY
jgi:hypothetical protein